jgi:hypothetical protein
MLVNTRKSCFFALVFFLFLFSFQSCKEEKSVSPNLTHENKVKTTVYEGITELLPGDIIVKPNTNFLPGTAFVSGGTDFGHAVIVVKGYKHNNIDSLLAGATIIEAIAKDVPPAFQVREIAAFKQSNIEAFNNVNFGRKYTGKRYRLRLPLPQSAIDSIVSFALDQKGDLYSWTATKRFPDNPITDSLLNSGIRKNWGDNSVWYCSLLVWQSVYFVTGIDLDPNSGYRVYPNDLIKSEYFDYLHAGQQGRVRF